MTNPFDSQPAARRFPRLVVAKSEDTSPRPPSRNLFVITLLSLALGATLLNSFSDARTTELAITHSFDGAPIQNAHWHRNASGELLTLTRLSYFISELEFVASDGSLHRPQNSILYVDAFNPNTPGTPLDLAPKTYTTLRFKIGLAPERNHSDPNQYPPNHPLSILENAMYWSWQGGYLFCAIEGYTSTGDSDSQIGFSYHIANDDFLVPIEIPLKLDTSSSQQITLNFDLAKVLEGSEFSLRQQTSTHSREGDPVAVSITHHLATAFRIQTTSTDSPEPSPNPETQNPANAKTAKTTPYPFALPRNFPIPDLPTDYPLTEERVTLGQTLFNSTQLSRNNTLSCASCHAEDNAFSDPRKFSVGFDGTLGHRQSMPLLNLAWKKTFFWDGRAASLREQVLHPIQNPAEMGADLPTLLVNLQNDPTIARLFQSAFGDPEITADRLSIALESFLLTLTSYSSKFDVAVAGKTELTKQEERGFELFMTEYDPRRGQYGADCFHCHGSSTFSDHKFHNNGLPQTDDRGLAEFTGLETDTAKFATPSLRNVALTAPYMHDGRFQNLEQVIEHYNSGIQNSDTLDPNLAKHPSTGLALTEADKAALVSFLETLTDPRLQK